MSILNKIKIEKRMFMGFFIILSLTLAINFFALYQINKLSNRTELLYEHPLTVSNAVLVIHVKIAKMHRSMKDIAFSVNMESINKNSLLVDSLEVSVLEQFEIITKQFLEGKERYSQALDEFIAWKPIRDEVIELMLKGKRREAAIITSGKGAFQIMKIEEALDYLVSLALDKAKSYISETQNTSKISFIFMSILTFFSLFIGMLLAFSISKSITGPLKIFQNVSRKLGEGDLSVKVDIHSRDEFGSLAATFNDMTNKLFSAHGQLKTNNAIFDNLAEGAYLISLDDLTIKWTNSVFDEMFGYEPEELIGKMVDVVNAPTELTPKETRLAIIGMLKETGVWHGEVQNIKKDGEPFWCYANVSTFIHSEYGEVFVSVHTDITDRKKAEEKVKKQLLEKEIILKETHHRIKNNFASVISLLSLQAQSTSNNETYASLQDAIGRVNSMFILYEKFLLTDDYKFTSVKEYLSVLADDIIELFPGELEITVEKQISDFNLEPERLVHLGIIVNELLTNIMKYAFTERDSGRIEIMLKENQRKAVLIIQDDGKGLPEGFDLSESKGFGLVLIKMLCQQLDGTFLIENESGTKATLEFVI
jgi:PAS domain S-box-containing protein